MEVIRENCRRREEGELIFSGKIPVEKLSVNPAGGA
jgi:hypothetical protein